MAKIHNALLACLSDTAAISGVEDYHPGIIELYEQFAFTPFSTVLPLGISRNGVDVFNGRTDIIPYLKIIKKTGGGYVLID